MDSANFLKFLGYVIPSLITGGVAYFFFMQHVKNEKERRIYLLRKEKQSLALPTRLQAYERMTLFLERISPSKLLIRVMPSGNDKVNYQKKLINAIETEFEHNLAQQVYLTSECWNVILAAKNTTMHMIRTATANTGVADAKGLQEFLLKELAAKEPPSTIALTFLKEEVHTIF
tara:strand:+ start:390935 stop:391456 length:522 start_codon:yes stop_codon:yes gene_type:complete